MSTEIETESLATHVALCEIRYQNLHNRLDKLEEKMNEFHSDLTKNASKMTGIIITSTATIVASILGLITTILMKF